MAVITPTSIVTSLAAASPPLSRANDEGIARLRRMYVFAEYCPPDAFLAENPSVVSKLLEAREHIEAIWGRDAAVVLDLAYDHDDPHQGELFALIQTHEDVPRAMESLRRFNESWWNERRRTVFGTLEFDIRCL